MAIPIDQIPQEPMDCYQAAKFIFGIADSRTATLAADMMRAAGWAHTGDYNECGEEVWSPPTDENKE